MIRATLDKPNTDTQTSPMDAVYPALQTKSELRKYENFVILNKWFKQDWIALHPSEAVMISLFNGTLPLPQAGMLWAYIYNFPIEDGLAMAEACVKKCRNFIQLRSEPSELPLHYFNPKDFIYNVRDESVYQTSITSHVTGDRFPIPIELSLNLTQFCNFKCEYCYAEVTSTAPSPKNPTKWLDLPKCLSLVEEAADLGVIFMGITGGEPTAFKGWMDVVLKTLELNMIPVMTTNGSIISRQQLEILAAAGMKDLTISLDAPSADLHHQITQTHNTFERVVTAIQNSVEAGIHTIVKCVLTSSNYQKIPEFIDFVVGLGVQECGITYMEEGARNSCATKISPQIEYESLISLRQVVLQKRQDYSGICEIWPPKDPKQNHRSGFVPCGGMYSSIVVNSKGGVNICDKLVSEEDFIFGDTFQQSLKEIWEGEKYRALRDKTWDSLVIDPICQGCTKLKVCRTGCYIKSLIHTGNPFSKDPNCGGPY
jgi:radical SAM protein with 4Fe4S-binding SPASM domain